MTFSLSHLFLQKLLYTTEFDIWVKQFRNGTSKDLDAIWDQVMREV